MAKAKAAGSFLGGLFGNPVVALLLLGLGALLIFRKDITNFLDKGIGNITFPDIPNPFEGFEFPTFTNPFEGFEFPTFEIPDFSSIFEGFKMEQEDFFKNFQDQFTNLFKTEIEQPQKMVEDTGLIDFSKCQCGATIIQDAFGNVFSECKKCQTIDDQLPSLDPTKNIPDTSDLPFGGLFDFLGLTPAQKFALDKGLSPEQEAQIIVPPSDIFGFGGGGSFMGGVTTLGSNIVDTLTEVLQAFPNLTASQAANLLESNQGLTQTEFSFINPFNPSISSAGGDPEQILLNASGGFSGLTPEQIALLLTGGNIQNF